MHTSKQMSFQLEYSKTIKPLQFSKYFVLLALDPTTHGHGEVLVGVVVVDDVAHHLVEH